MTVRQQNEAINKDAIALHMVKIRLTSDHPSLIKCDCHRNAAKYFYARYKLELKKKYGYK